MNKVLFKSKTLWTGIGGIIAAIGGAVTGTMDIPSAIQLAITSALAIFIRDGIAGK